MFHRPFRLLADWRRLGLVLGALALLALACDKDDDREGWQTRVLWPTGSGPVPSPVHGDVLFAQEEGAPGLYLLRAGQAIRITPDSVAARGDYAWSPDGSRFCFSSPGPHPGIYVGMRDNPASLRRILSWGQHPRFSSSNMSVVFAGGPGEAPGIREWIEPEGDVRGIAPDGYAPEFSPDGFKLAYLLPTGAVGGILVVLDRATGDRDTLTGTVLNYAWLGNSEGVVFESTVEGTQTIRTISVSSPGATPVTQAFGTHPAGFPSGSDFLFTGLSGDRLDGIWIGGSNARTRISSAGSWPRAVSIDRIVAQDGGRLIDIAR